MPVKLSKPNPLLPPSTMLPLLVATVTPVGALRMSLRVVAVTPPALVSTILPEVVTWTRHSHRRARHH